MRTLSAGIAIVVSAQFALAQSPAGIVSDSSTRQPIAGAVVSLIDSAGTTIARFITNARGEYRFPEFTLGRRMRIVRMGYRPRDVRLPSPLSGSIDVRMASIPMMLDQVTAVANTNCPRRSDRAAAFALLEQARAGLLNAVVARETHPAAMTVLPFERFLDGTSDRIERQEVRIRSSERVTTSFNAVRRASDFVRDGFAADNGQTRHYFGPDADVLLDADFAAGYCFQLRAAERSRPTVVGLRFVPARRRADRVDIDGTLWVDTAARKLVSMEHQYLGLPAWTDVVDPGGRATFWELPNGVVFIDKWHFRLPVPETDTTYSFDNRSQVRFWYSARESGGEVATASWPDGAKYQGPLGILNARALAFDRTPLTGITVRLADTDYLASPDSAGFFAIPNLLPGPYEAVVVHPELADLGILLPTSLRFLAVRDSVVQQTMTVLDYRRYVSKRCSTTARMADKPVVFDLRQGDSAARADSALTILVITPDRKPVAGARWRVSKAVAAPYGRIVESRETDERGLARSCLRIEVDDDVEVSAWRPGEPARLHRFTVRQRGTYYTITLPFDDP